MRTGMIKRYWNGRGFGFIVPDDGGDDVFLHVSVLHDENLIARLPDRLEGARVEFTTKPRLSRLAVETVRKL